MIQFLIVAAIVAFCAWQLGKRFWPKKAVAKVADAGCGSGGCDTCGACKTFTFEAPEPK